MGNDHRHSRAICRQLASFFLHDGASASARLFCLFFPCLMTQILASPAASAPTVAPQHNQPHCPQVVHDFLDDIGLLSDVPADMPPVVVIDLQGAAVDCLPRSLPPADHAEAVWMLHETSKMFSLHSIADDEFHTRYGRACMVGLGGGQDGKRYLGLVVSYDLAHMTRPACIQRARSSIEHLLDGSG